MIIEKKTTLVVNASQFIRKIIISTILITSRDLYWLMSEHGVGPNRCQHTSLPELPIISQHNITPKYLTRISQQNMSLWYLTLMSHYNISPWYVTQNISPRYLTKICYQSIAPKHLTIICHHNISLYLTIPYSISLKCLLRIFHPSSATLFLHHCHQNQCHHYEYMLLR